MKVTKEEYFESVYVHAFDFTAQAVEAIEVVAGIKLDNRGKSALFGTMLKGCVYQGVHVLKMLHQQSWDVSDLLQIKVEDLENWIVETKRGELRNRK